MISESLGRLPKYPLLFLIPIIVDGLSMLLGLSRHGLGGIPHTTFKLTLQMGLPSISAVTDQGSMPVSIPFSGFGGFAPVALVYLAFTLCLSAFLQGGYVGLLFESSKRNGLSMEKFIAYGSRFFSRFLLLQLLILALLFVLGSFLTAFMMSPGVLVFLILFILLRILFLYLEFTIVAEDCSLSQAFSRSREAFRYRTPATLPLVAVALVVNFVAALLINALWLPVFYLVFVIVYDFIGAGLQLAFMLDYRRIRG